MFPLGTRQAPEKGAVTMEKLTEEGMAYIVARLIQNANEAVREYREERTDLFKDGRAVAYYEMLSILQSELDARQQDLRRFGLDVDLVKEFL